MHAAHYARILHIPNLHLCFFVVRLTIEVAIYCGTNYYGPQCETYCMDADDCTGHYTCDPDTGAQVCLEGWSGDHCLEQSIGYDECPPYNLSNGRTFFTSPCFV